MLVVALLVLVTMVATSKRHYISKSNQEQLVQAFYDNPGNDEASFLGHRFLDEDDSDVENGTNLEKESEGEDADTALELIVNDVAVADNAPLVKALILQKIKIVMIMSLQMKSTINCKKTKV